MMSTQPEDHAAPLESPTGSRRVRPSTAWILGLFGLTAVVAILRHCISNG